MSIFSKNTKPVEAETKVETEIEPAPVSKPRFELIETCCLCVAANIMIYYDTTTKVMYQARFEGKGHITPLYNADGTLALYDETE